MILGTAKAEIPIGACFLNVWPILPISLTLPLGGFGAGTGNITVFATIPAGLPSGTLTMQAVVADLGVVQGASATNGLALVVP